MGSPPSVDRFVIRRASQEDGEGILSCLAAAFEQYAGAYTPGAYADTTLTRETVGDRIDHAAVFVAIDLAGQVAGTVGVEFHSRQTAHLRGMAVLPEYQGTGLARRLLAEAEAEGARCGRTRMTLDTTEPLERAARFYERNGYRRTGRVTDFFGMPISEFVKRLSGV